MVDWGKELKMVCRCKSVYSKSHYCWGGTVGWWYCVHLLGEG